MGRRALFAIVFMACAGSAHAADQLTPARVWNATAIASTATLTSPALDLRRQDFEALVYQASSVAGTADVKIEYAICRDDCLAIPVTSCTCGAFADNAALVASTNALSNPEGWHTALGVTVGAIVMKIKITGSASNNADTLFSADFVGREYSGTNR